MLKVKPYKIGSKSAKALARALGCLRIRTPGYRPTRRDLIINWGDSDVRQPVWNATVLNHPQAVGSASNKIKTLTLLTEANVPCIPWTTHPHVAEEWLQDGRKVVVRHTVTGHSGEGVEILDPENTCSIPPAPLYTRYWPKDGEYRVHVFQDAVIDIAKKRRRGDYESNPDFDERVRTHSRGWVFARENVEVPFEAQDIAINAIMALGLDFGAVDMLVRGDKWVVLEINTAPGLEGSTVDNYADAFRCWADRRFI